MQPIGIPLILAVIWGGLMVFVWRSISRDRRVTKSIVAIVGGLTCLMIFRVGDMLSAVVEEHDRMAASLDRLHSAPAKTETGVEAQDPAIQEIRIHVNEAGTLSLDGRPLDDASLEAELMKLTSGNSKMVVTIIADELAPYQRVIDVLNLCARARIENVTFEVPPEE